MTKQTTQAAGTMTLTANEISEYQRAAKALYARGATEQGTLLSVVAAKKTVPTEQFDRAGKAYRAWLVFDEPKGARALKATEAELDRLAGYLATTMGALTEQDVTARVNLSEAMVLLQNLRSRS